METLQYLEMAGISVGSLGAALTAYYFFKRYIKNSSCHIETTNGLKIEIDDNDLDKAAETIQKYLESKPELKNKVEEKILSPKSKDIV